VFCVEIDSNFYKIAPKVVLARKFHYLLLNAIILFSNEYLYRILDIFCFVFLVVPTRNLVREPNPKAGRASLLHFDMMVSSYSQQ